MRNLKRALSLGLASSMVLGTMAFGTSASVLEKFNDADQITNEKAVGIVNTIGLMLGDDDGNFNPGEAVTRAEMAVICTTMLNEAGFHASQFVGTQVFDDVPEWAQDYVNLAASLGIVAGVGDNKFEPNTTVTTAQAVLMILRTLGYYDVDDTRLGSELASNWSLSATRLGTSIGLYDASVDGDLAADQPLTRENVASIAFRALTDVVQVDYNPSTTAYYNYGGSMQNQVDNSTTEHTLGYKNFNQLFADNSTFDEFGRPSVTWMYNGNQIDNYTKEATHTFTEEKTVKEMYNTIGSALLNNEEYDRAIYVNGELLTADYVKENGNALGVDSTSIEGFNSLFSNSDTTPFLETGAGVLTEVYVISPTYTTDNYGNRYLKNEGQIIVSMIHTYLGEVVDVDDLGDGVYKYTVDMISKKETEVEQSAVLFEKSTYTYETTEEFYKEDVVRVNMAGNGEKDYEIVTFEYPELVNGNATSSNLSPDVKGGRWLCVDGGDPFYYAYSVRGNISDDEAMAPVTNTEIDVYLDEYGYVLGYDAIVPDDQYLYVVDRGSYSLSNNAVRVMFSDGTEAIINVTELDNNTLTNSLWQTIPASNRVSDDDGNVISANENYAYVTEEDGYLDGETLQPRIYGYVALSDGTYRLTTDIQETKYDYSDSYSEGVLPGINNDWEYYNSDSDYNGLHGLNDTTSFVHSPEKDTMFIYNSVYYGKNAEKDVDGNYTVTGVATGDNSTGADDGSKYVFKIEKNKSRVIYNSAGHAFAVDGGTTFIDVVNGNVWNGYTNVTSMTDGDVNMQVVFGKGGIADFVFINNGAPAASAGNYFFVQDNKATWENIDGTDYYTYNVWDLNDNEAREIVVKDTELKDTISKQGLNNNDVYRITNEDSDGYITSVERYYELDGYANAAYKRSEGPVSAVTTVGDGVLLMAKEGANSEYYDEDDSRSGANFWGISDLEAVGYEEEADGFTFNSSTQFIVLTANGEVDKDSNAMYSVRSGSADDIRTTGESNTTWVDVLSADNDGSNNTHPYARVVLIIKPYGDVTGDDGDNSKLLKDAPTDVVRAEFAGNGTGSTATDYAEVVGKVNLTDVKVENTWELVQHIASVYAEENGWKADGSESLYTIELVSAGTDFTDGNSGGTRRWIVRIDGTGSREGEERYISIAFDASSVSGGMVSFSPLYDGVTAGDKETAQETVDTLADLLEDRLSGLLEEANYSAAELKDALDGLVGTGFEVELTGGATDYATGDTVTGTLTYTTSTGDTYEAPFSFELGAVTGVTPPEETATASVIEGVLETNKNLLASALANVDADDITFSCDGDGAVTVTITGGYGNTTEIQAAIGLFLTGVQGDVNAALAKEGLTEVTLGAEPVETGSDFVATNSLMPQETILSEINPGTGKVLNNNVNLSGIVVGTSEDGVAEVALNLNEEVAVGDATADTANVTMGNYIGDIESLLEGNTLNLLSSNDASLSAIGDENSYNELYTYTMLFANETTNEYVRVTVKITVILTENSDFTPLTTPDADQLAENVTALEAYDPMAGDNTLSFVNGTLDSFGEYAEGDCNYIVTGAVLSEGTLTAFVDEIVAELFDGITAANTTVTELDADDGVATVEATIDGVVVTYTLDISGISTDIGGLSLEPIADLSEALNYFTTTEENLANVVGGADYEDIDSLELEVDEGGTLVASAGGSADTEAAAELQADSMALEVAGILEDQNDDLELYTIYAASDADASSAKTSGTVAKVYMAVYINVAESTFVKVLINIEVAYGETNGGTTDDGTEDTTLTDAIAYLEAKEGDFELTGNTLQHLYAAVEAYLATSDIKDVGNIVISFGSSKDNTNISDEKSLTLTLTYDGGSEDVLVNFTFLEGDALTVAEACKVLEGAEFTIDSKTTKDDLEAKIKAKYADVDFTDTDTNVVDDIVVTLPSDYVAGTYGDLEVTLTKGLKSQTVTVTLISQDMKDALARFDVVVANGVTVNVENGKVATEELVLADKDLAELIKNLETEHGDDFSYELSGNLVTKATLTLTITIDGVGGTVEFDLTVIEAGTAVTVTLPDGTEVAIPEKYANGITVAQFESLAKIELGDRYTAGGTFVMLNDVIYTNDHNEPIRLYADCEGEVGLVKLTTSDSLAVTPYKTDVTFYNEEDGVDYDANDLVAGETCYYVPVGEYAEFALRPTGTLLVDTEGKIQTLGDLDLLKMNSDRTVYHVMTLKTDDSDVLVAGQKVTETLVGNQGETATLVDDQGVTATYVKVGSVIEGNVWMSYTDEDGKIKYVTSTKTGNDYSLTVNVPADLGDTSAVSFGKMIDIEVDGKAVSVTDDTTVVEYLESLDLISNSYYVAVSTVSAAKNEVLDIGDAVTATTEIAAPVYVKLNGGKFDYSAEIEDTVLVSGDLVIESGYYNIKKASTLATGAGLGSAEAATIIVGTYKDNYDVGTTFTSCSEAGLYIQVAEGESLGIRSTLSVRSAANDEVTVTLKLNGGDLKNVLLGGESQTIQLGDVDGGYTADFIAGNAANNLNLIVSPTSADVVISDIAYNVENSTDDE